jgi:hypothetical protein
MSSCFRFLCSQSVLGIRDIFVRIRILLQMDPTPFFSDLKDVKKNFFLIFFSFNLPAGTLSSDLKLNFYAKINFALQFYFASSFQSAQHLYEKSEGSGSIPLINGSGIREAQKHADPDP